MNIFIAFIKAEEKAEAKAKKNKTLAFSSALLPLS
jgi:hypothetical protein